jgi:hypothetical protein
MKSGLSLLNPSTLSTLIFYYDMILQLYTCRVIFGLTGHPQAISRAFWHVHYTIAMHKL